MMMNKSFYRSKSNDGTKERNSRIGVQRISPRKRQRYWMIVLLSAGVCVYLVCSLMSAGLFAQTIRSGFGGGGFGRSRNQQQTMTDSRGFKWDLYLKWGMIRRGTNHAFSGAGRLFVKGNAFRPQQQKRSGNNSFLLTGKMAGLTVERRIHLDSDKAALRYIDTFKNTSSSDQQINAVIKSELGRRKSGIQSNTGRSGLPLQKKEAGVVIHQNHSPSILLVIRGKNSHDQNNLTSSVKFQGRDEFNIHYNVTVPANGSASITYTMAQRKTKNIRKKKQIKKEFKPFLSASWLKNVPSDIRKSILNGASTLWMIGNSTGKWEDYLEKLDLESAPSDQLVLEEDMKLQGTVPSGRVKIDTRFGNKEFPLDRVAAATGKLFDRENQLLFLKDGRILQGELTFKEARFQMQAGPSINLTSNKLDRFARSRSSRDKNLVSDVSGYVELVSGERFALADAGLRIPVVTPWGKIDLPVDRLLLVKRSTDGSSASEILLKNGTRLHGFLESNRVDVTLKTFGSQTIQLTKLVQIVSGDLISGTVNMKQLRQRVESRSRARLAGQNLVVGDIKAETLWVVNRGGTYELEANQIRELVQLDGAPDAQPRFRVTLWEGGTISGRLDRRIIRLASSDLTLTVPSRYLKKIERPEQAVPSNLKKKIARKIRELGHPSWKVREEASKRLKEIGALAVPQLRDAKSERKDPEIKRRVKMILQEVQQ